MGQGCLYFTNSGEKLVSNGFDTCSPLIIISKDKTKYALGHIDSQTTPKEIINLVRQYFKPKEIREATFKYYRGEESFSPSLNLGDSAIKTIEDALKSLHVKGDFGGKINGFDDVILSVKGLNILS